MKLCPHYSSFPHSSSWCELALPSNGIQPLQGQPRESSVSGAELTKLPGSAESHSRLVSESSLQRPPHPSLFLSISSKFPDIFRQYRLPRLYLPRPSALSFGAMLSKPHSFSTGNAFGFLETAQGQPLLTPHPPTPYI